MTSWTMPNHHYQRLTEIYEQLSHEDLDIKSEDFPWKVGFRIYTEFCLAYEHRADMIPNDRQDTFPFLSYIGKEIHHTLERAGYSWNEDHFEGVDDKIYRATEDKVLQALAKSAIDYFREKITNPETKRNLRCSLEPWIV
ncbi:MAG: hypothetical protein V1870_02405 [Candidatus Aenigmatarchaeota archaeon]